MIKSKAIYGSNLQLFRLFDEFLKPIVQMARESEHADAFKQKLRKYLMGKESAGEGESEKVKRLLLLIENDGVEVDEFSTGTKIRIRTIGYLWELLANGLSEKASPDLFIDLFHLFILPAGSAGFRYDTERLKRSMDRWPSGLKQEIIAVRETNSTRIIKKLVARIEPNSPACSKYYFAEGMSDDAKYKQVETWWQSAKFHLAMALKTPAALDNFLDHTLSQETMLLLTLAKKKGMPFFVTPYYLSLLCTGGEYDDAAIRSYVLYSPELVEAYGAIKAWEKEDVIVSGKPNAAGWLLPQGHNIHRRYPEVAILIPDSMGRACGGLCASCQRMYDFQSNRFNFDLDTLKPKEGWPRKLERLMRYFEEDTQLRDILITGGDAFMSRNATLKNILDAVCAMARRKRKANRLRGEGEKYAELQRVRLGSRLLAYLPMRIDEELITILREFKEKAAREGVSQFIVQTHFQSPLEMTPEALRAVEAIQSAGWTITNQHVYTVPASRRGHNAKLRRVLNQSGIVCYYTFSVKGFEENYAVFTPNSRSVQEQKEEKAAGLLTDEQQHELYTRITGGQSPGPSLKRFLKTHRLPFAATDRNVLNLPAIGKSMTFTTVGITREGKRILRFDYDTGRPHSPAIDSNAGVYIVENKSVAAYLRQLEQLSENAKDYESVWMYTESLTEPRFSLYSYPEYGYEVTGKMTNIG